MSPEHWKRIEEAFDTLLDTPPASREVLLAQLCDGDEEMRRELASLLASLEAAGSYLEAPAHEMVSARPRTSQATNPAPAAPAVARAPARPHRTRAWRALAWAGGGVAVVLVATAVWLAVVHQRAAPPPYATVQLARLDLIFGEPVRGHLSVGGLQSRAAELARRLPADDPARVHLESVLGNIALLLGQYEEAQRRLDAALGAWRRLKGPASLEVAACLHGLGRLHHELGRFEAAEDAYRRALALRERLLPDGHADVAASLNNLGVLLVDRGDTSAAATLRAALALRTRRLGPRHPDVTITINNLGRALQQGGQLAGAGEHYRRALDGLEVTLGRTHPRTVAVRANLAGLLYDQGRLDEALDLQHTVVDQSRHLYEASHPALGTALLSYAVILQARRDLEAAASAYGEAEEILRRLPEAHPARATLVVGYGTCLTSLRRFGEAEALLAPAFERYRAEHGPAHDRTRAVGRALVLLYERWNRPDRASHYRSAIASLE